MAWPLFLYNLLLLLGVILLSPLWIGYVILSPKARSGFWQKVTLYPRAFLTHLHTLRQARGNPIWFHAVSVGEFNAIRPLLDRYRNNVPIVLSTTTRTGQALAKQTYPDLPIFYFPYDVRPLVHRALKIIRPAILVLTETEIWPNMIDVAARHYQTPILMINGRISPHSFQGYRRIRPLTACLFSQMHHLYMQSQGDADRVRILGAPSDSITVAGNIKFDLSHAIDPIQKSILHNLLGFSAQDTVITFASTHSGEDLPLVETFLKLKKDFPELKLVLAPRHPERVGEIRTLLKAKMLPFSLRSTLSETNPNREAIVVLDTIGELQTVYGLSRLAVIGGSFRDVGGHNPLEALALKIPAVFGPHMFNFPDISRLIQEYQAGFQVDSYDTLADTLTELLTQPEMYSNVVENGQRLLATNRGAKEVLSCAIDTLSEPRVPTAV